MKYEKPIWEWIELETSDIVCDSNTGLEGGGTGDDDNPWV